MADGNATRIFAVIFGHGRHLLQDGALEERFGLKVVLNSVDPDSLRSIDKTALGSVPKQSREQISREGGAASFGIDIEQDLVNSVTGKSRVERFGRTITGREPALPVSRSRCAHFTALATLTSKLVATSRLERPDKTAAATRSRKSAE